MSDSTSYTAADLRNALLKRAADGRAGAVPESLSAPTQRALRNLVDYVMYYDPSTSEELPQDVTESHMYRVMFTHLESLQARDAVRTGNVSKMRGIAGAQYNDAKMDTSSWRSAEVLTDVLWRPEDRDHMVNLIIYGPTPKIKTGSNTGSGKSDFAYSALEGGIRAYERVGKTLQIASNNDTDPFEQVERWTDAEKWMKEVDGPKVLLLDEAAQGLMYADMSAGKVVSRVIKLMRKYHCHLILIGHTGKDIPQDVRRQVVYARKENKKNVTLGNKLEEDSSGEMQIKNVEFELGKLPPTNLEYESIDDKGEFEWDIDETTSADSEDDSGANEPVCQAETNDGDPCPATAQYPKDSPLVCYNHRPKLDEVREEVSEED
jgi:hypothetical protein